MSPAGAYRLTVDGKLWGEFATAAEAEAAKPPPSYPWHSLVIAIAFRYPTNEPPASLFACADPIEGLNRWADEGGSVAYEMQR